MFNFFDPFKDDICFERLFITSDLHAYHKNICAGSTDWDRGADRQFDNPIEMTNTLIENINETVGENDLLISMGDWAFGGPDKARKFRNLINCRNIAHIFGNHDKNAWKNRDMFIWTGHYNEFRFDKKLICMMHYPLASWNESGRGSIMLHGHCVDKETEILTYSGWKKHDQIIVGEPLPTYSQQLGKIVDDTVKDVLSFDYIGDMYTHEGKSINLRVTSNHTMIHFGQSDHIVHKISAQDLFKRKTAKFKRCGIHTNQSGIKLSNDLIKLYVLISSDGSVKNDTKLVRIRIKKDHKQKYLRSVLKKLDLDFEELKNDKYVSFNFYLPEELSKFKIKGNDPQLDDINQEQFKILLEAYAHSDGNKNGKGYIIYSSKEGEIDQLQMIAIQNGFGATKHERVHGFSSNPSYQLSVYPSKFNNIQKLDERHSIENVQNEFVWCIKTHNQNFFMRRMGKVHLTGNCHNHLHSDFTRGRIFDVGVDNPRWNFRPVAFSELFKIAMNTDIFVSDHHSGDLKGW